jgi:ATP/ADP translocase
MKSPIKLLIMNNIPSNRFKMNEFWLFLIISLLFLTTVSKTTTTHRKKKHFKFYSISLIKIKEIESSGKVAIQLLSFENTQDLDYRGLCCNGDQVLLNNSPNPVCSKHCNTLITLCLDNYYR